MRLRISDAALAEVSGAFDHYENEKAGLGPRFAQALGIAIHDILESPETPRLLRGGYRRQNLYRFPYGVFYRLEGGLVTIVAIAHHRRRPGYWRSRA